MIVSPFATFTSRNLQITRAALPSETKVAIGLCNGSGDFVTHERHGCRVRGELTGESDVVCHVGAKKLGEMDDYSFNVLEWIAQIDIEINVVFAAMPWPCDDGLHASFSFFAIT